MKKAKQRPNKGLWEIKQKGTLLAKENRLG